MEEAIEYSLVENALDYLLLAGEQAKTDSVRMLKHALATLYDGIELLLKARLQLHDWSLVFSNVDKANKASFKSGDFQSVTFEQVIKRLQGICEVEIDGGHLKILEQLRQLRNRIRHFEVTTDKPGAISLISRTYSFALQFVKDELEHRMNVHAKSDVEDLRSLLGDFQAFVDERLKEIGGTIFRKATATCPVCMQDALTASHGFAACYFCGFSCNGEETAIKWFNCVGVTDRIYQCPACSKEACVLLDNHNDDYLCLSCGQPGIYDVCFHCGKLYENRDGVLGHCVICYEGTH